MEDLIVGILENALKDNLLGALGGGALGGIELPEIDLSESLGLPPGTAVIEIAIDEVNHSSGTSVISGHL